MSWEKTVWALYLETLVSSSHVFLLHSLFLPRTWETFVEHALCASFYMRHLCFHAAADHL